MTRPDRSPHDPADHHTLDAYTTPGLAVRRLAFDLPLDPTGPGPATLRVFAREVVAAEKRHEELPYLLYLTGGPGFGAPRPLERSGWLARALREFRVLLLDQRGTGLSTPATAQTLADLGTPEAQAAYLAHFRADNIVRDAEAIRAALIGDRSWSVLGQSFGGFCVLHYLSAAPEGLTEALVTGGVPSITRPAEDVYRATYRRVLGKNRQFYRRYPHARELAGAIAAVLDGEFVRLPNGQRLTTEQFQQLGIKLGSGTGAEQLYALLEEALVQVGGEATPSTVFLHGVMASLDYLTHPIFSLLHEAIYCQGRASAWAAQRLRAEFPEFDRHDGGPLLFTGEMIYPWMFEQYATLRPLAGAAELLAAKDDWPALYDPGVLARNAVPLAALAYHDDMFVEPRFSEETLAEIPNSRLWVTSEYEHDGLRADGERILERLVAMARGAL